MAATPDAAMTPIPDDDEAAAILAALASYLAAQRHPAPTPARTTARWALAGRLASHGRTVRPGPGVRITWANVRRTIE